MSNDNTGDIYICSLLTERLSLAWNLPSRLVWVVMEPLPASFPVLKLQRHQHAELFSVGSEDWIQSSTYLLTELSLSPSPAATLWRSPQPQTGSSYRSHTHFYPHASLPLPAYRDSLSRAYQLRYPIISHIVFKSYFFTIMTLSVSRASLSLHLAALLILLNEFYVPSSDIQGQMRCDISSLSDLLFSCHPHTEKQLPSLPPISLFHHALTHAFTCELLLWVHPSDYSLENRPRKTPKLIKLCYSALEIQVIKIFLGIDCYCAEILRWDRWHHNESWVECEPSGCWLHYRSRPNRTKWIKQDPLHSDASFH